MHSPATGVPARGGGGFTRRGWRARDKSGPPLPPQVPRPAQAAVERDGTHPALEQLAARTVHFLADLTEAKVLAPDKVKVPAMPKSALLKTAVRVGRAGGWGKSWRGGWARAHTARVLTACLPACLPAWGAGPGLGVQEQDGPAAGRGERGWVCDREAGGPRVWAPLVGARVCARALVVCRADAG